MDTLAVDMTLSDDSTESTDTSWARDYPLPPKLLTASEWAATEEGRKAFSSRFRITDVFLPDLADDNDPINYLVSTHYSSNEWLEAKQTDLRGVMADSTHSERAVRHKDFSYTRGIQAGYLAKLESHLTKKAKTPMGEKYDRADALRQPEYDDALTAHFPALTQICVEVCRLRDQVPPAGEAQWATVLNKLIDLATEKWEWAFCTYMGEPRLQAMPRPFARTPAQVVMDSVGLPRVFRPNRKLELRWYVSGPLNDRQRRCLVPTKKPSDSGLVVGPVVIAVGPIAAVEFKAALSDLAQVQGQALYSGVQAVGIYHTLGVDLQMLSISIAHGFAFPIGTCRAGSTDATDILRFQGEKINLGQLSGVVAFFLMLYNAAQEHVLAAFQGATKDELGSVRVSDSHHQPQRVVLAAGPLVDWRSRILPPAILAARQARRGNKPKTEEQLTAPVKDNHTTG
ncbi:hypothetical protein DFH09DRAFT_1306634 [Mycena vulgaris]|nr:hypothetical protein DFH09DRAFT_1306634 [Mycena vulgaris]